jgi:hypothetical protein
MGFSFGSLAALSASSKPMTASGRIAELNQRQMQGLTMAAFGQERKLQVKEKARRVAGLPPILMQVAKYDLNIAAGSNTSAASMHVGALGTEIVVYG